MAIKFSKKIHFQAAISNPTILHKVEILKFLFMFSLFMNYSKKKIKLA